MAENFDSEVVNLYQPKKRFIIPIDNFHIPKKLFKLFKRNTYTFKINSNFENDLSFIKYLKLCKSPFNFSRSIFLYFG